jgi:hypothetical protein
MKNLILILILSIFYSCSKETTIEDCGCVKTTTLKEKTGPTGVEYTLLSVEEIDCSEPAKNVLVRKTQNGVVFYDIICN